MASVFTKIILGELPSYKIYEDEWVFAFLARDAIQLGHSLVVPKIEVDHFIDVPEPYYSKVFSAALPIAKAIRQATQCNRLGTMISGFEVPHFHYHLVPMFDLSDLDHRKAQVRSESDCQEILKQIKSGL